MLLTLTVFVDLMERQLRLAVQWFTLKNCAPSICCKGPSLAFQKSWITGVTPAVNRICNMRDRKSVEMQDLQQCTRDHLH